MFFLGLALALSILLRSIPRFRSDGLSPFINGLSISFLAIGSLISRFTVSPNSSDYLLSYDQVFRGSLATGLTRWGIYNSNFGYGRQIPYHWLGESLTGLLARIGGISEIESVTRLSPYFGMMVFVGVCTSLLIALNASFFATVFVVFFSSSFINELDPASVGTIWGAVMFMATLLYAIAGLKHENSFFSSILLTLLTCLTILCQSVLGFILALSLIGLSVTQIFRNAKNRTFHINSMALLILASVTLQSVFFRRNSWFADDEIVGFSNWLKFPGVPIQLGSSIDSVMLAVRLNSLFFIFYLVSIFGVITFNFFRPDRLGTIAKLFGFQLLACIALFNFADLGWANGKFLAPINILGTFLGFLVIVRFFESIKYGFLKLLSLCFVIVISFVLQVRLISDFLINTQEGLLFLFFIGLSFVLVLRGVLQSWQFHNFKRPMGVGLVTMTLCSTFFVLHNVDSWQSSRVFQKRSSREGMFSSRETLDCLQFLKQQTAESSVIATSLWRIPGGTDEKYFLTSLLSHRLVILDGPVYSEMLDWQSSAYFENLKNIHTTYANSLDKSSNDQLFNLGATYFLLDTRFENSDRTWLNLEGQDVVFGNEDCSVIKLSRPST
jgi:hypothetical protein